jgi:hypothetical protein
MLKVRFFRGKFNFWMGKTGVGEAFKMEQNAIQRCIAFLGFYSPKTTKNPELSKMAPERF